MRLFLKISVALAIAVLTPAQDGRTDGHKQQNVVVSIAPLHSLVAGVVRDANEAVLLVPGGDSPHGLGLKPSQMKKLTEAKAVFFVSSGLETFLHNPLRSLPDGVAQVEVAEISGITPLKDSHGHNDPHIWLSPKNAEKIVLSTAKRMSQISPRNKGVYKKNARETIQKLKKLDVKIRAELAGVGSVPYAVFHEAYLYFERDYGTNSIGAITIKPENLQSAAELKQIRTRIREQGAVCVFSEPQFGEKLVLAAVEGTGAKTGVLDPLGAGIEPGPELYFKMMENLTSALKNCLSGRG